MPRTSVLSPITTNDVLMNPDGTATPYFQQYLNVLFEEKGAFEADPLNAGGAPGADRLIIWDESAGEFVYATAAEALELAGSTRGSMLYRGETGWTLLAPGAENQVLKMGADDPEWSAAGGGGGGAWTSLGRTAFSAVSGVDIDLPDDYDDFLIRYYIEFSASADLILQLSDDGFATVKSGASDYSWNIRRRTAGSWGYSADTADSRIETLGAVGSFGPFVADIRIHNAKEANRTKIETQGTYENLGVNFMDGVASYLGTESMDGLRLSPTSGTITGYYKAWGVVA